MKNFANTILKGEKLVAPAEEGIHSVELANANSSLRPPFLIMAISLVKPMD